MSTREDGVETKSKGVACFSTSQHCVGRSSFPMVPLTATVWINGTRFQWIDTFSHGLRFTYHFLFLYGQISEIPQHNRRQHSSVRVDTLSLESFTPWTSFALSFHFLPFRFLVEACCVHDGSSTSLL